MIGNSSNVNSLECYFIIMKIYERERKRRTERMKDKERESAFVLVDFQILEKKCWGLK